MPENTEDYTAAEIAKAVEPIREIPKAEIYDDIGRQTLNTIFGENIVVTPHSRYGYDY
jgi:hypothetical protein